MKDLLNLLEENEILRKKAIAKAAEKFDTIEQGLKENLFKAYSEDVEIKKAISDLENHEGVYYSWQGDFVSAYIDLTDSRISQLPYFDEFLEDCCINLETSGGVRISQCLGTIITVNISVRNYEEVAYCYDTHQSILNKHVDGIDRLYLAAKIAQFQNEQGVYNHVFNSNYCGELTPFSFDELLTKVKSLDDTEGLERVIASYEDETSQILAKLAK